MHCKLFIGFSSFAHADDRWEEERQRGDAGWRETLKREREDLLRERCQKPEEAFREAHHAERDAAKRPCHVFSPVPQFAAFTAVAGASNPVVRHVWGRRLWQRV